MQRTADPGRARRQAIGEVVRKAVPPGRGRPRGTLGIRGLTLIGVGGIIGAGFFLGAGMPIHTAGPSVLLAFLLGAVITAQVTGALASVAIRDPEPGSFVAYTTTYISNYAGFLQGWTYYFSSIVTVASEATAMSIFTRFWLPAIPTWLMAAVYAAVVVAINAFGVKNFGVIESLMSVVKIGALVGFILFLGYEVFAVMPGGVGMLGHLFGGGTSGATTGTALGAAGAARGGFFPYGWTGMFQSMLIVIFSYAGIGVFATATPEMRRPRDINKAAWYTVLILTVLYIVSIGLLLLVVPWQVTSTHVSPFVTALKHTTVPVLAQVLNGIVLVASFSVMAGAVFSSNQILKGLARRQDAPQFVGRTVRNRVPVGALVVTSVGIGLTMFVSYVLPANMYNFMISAASFLTFLNWLLILWAFLAWRKRDVDGRSTISSLAFGQPWSSVATMAFILFLAGYALLQRDQRFGFYASAMIIAAVSLAYVVMMRRRHGHDPAKP